MASNFIPTLLVTLGILEGTSGYIMNRDDKVILDIICSLEGTICEFIALESTAQIGDKIKFYLDDVRENYELLNQKIYISLTLPLKMPSNFTSYEVNTKVDLLNVISDVVNELAADNTGSRLNSDYIYSDCKDFRKSGLRFCDEHYNANTFVSNMCCSNIGSYIVHPNVSSISALSGVIDSTTFTPEIISSTTLGSKLGSKINNSTNIEQTTSIPTALISINQSGISKLNVVLIALLLLVVAISAFMGYRSYKAKKSLQLQPVLQSSSAIINRDETEDLV